MPCRGGPTSLICPGPAPRCSCGPWSWPCFVHQAPSGPTLLIWPWSWSCTAHLAPRLGPTPFIRIRSDPTLVWLSSWPHTIYRYPETDPTPLVALSTTQVCRPCEGCSVAGRAICSGIFQFCSLLKEEKRFHPTPHPSSSIFHTGDGEEDPASSAAEAWL